MAPQIETLRVLHKLDYENYNEDLGCIEYTDRQKEKVILVVANKKGRVGSVNTNIARLLKTFLEETDFKDVYIFGETQTATAYNILKYNEKTTVYTSNNRIQLRTSEVLEAFTQRALERCETICGVKPVDKDDCKATKKGAETCDIRTLLDNAEFHAKMGWKDQLLQGFQNLMDLEPPTSEDPDS
jgi:hypothetical protein